MARKNYTYGRATKDNDGRALMPKGHWKNTLKKKKRKSKSRK